MINENMKEIINDLKIELRILFKNIDNIDSRNIWQIQGLLGELEHEQWKLRNESEINNNE